MKRASSFEEVLQSDPSGKTAVQITWKNLNFAVREKDSKASKFGKPVFTNKLILRDMQGHAQSGELLAIMGPTGCGKTSLLNVLAARVAATNAATSRLTGEILINGRPRNDEAFRRISAYVLQDDKLYPHLTVHETLMLAAHFFLPNEVSDEEKEIRVTAIIAELGLVKARNTCIGDEKVRGISGGERKRANVAVQLISNPTVLLMDEPTSGLDSFQAQAIMESMKNLAKNGRLVISVIHQPRSSIFAMFDKLLLLSEGRSMFLGKATDAVLHFERLGHKSPPFFNPSDFFLDILSPDIRTLESEAETYARIADLGEAWRQHEVAVGLPVVESTDDDNSNLFTVPTCAESFDWKRFARNFKLLAWRSSSEQLREVPTIVIKFCITTFFALIIGGIYSNVGYNQKSIQNRTGLLFVIAINQAFNGVIGVLNTFPKEKVIVQRERSARAYDTLSYFFAKYLVEMPLNMMPCVLFGCIVYWIVGLNPSTFGFFLLILMLEALTAVSLGLAVSALMPNVEAANAAGPPAIIIALLFGGFFINVNSLPIVANWIPYVSFLKWTFESLAINEFKGETFDCSNGPPLACERTGEVVLARLSFGNDTIYESTFGLGMVLLGFTVMAIFILDRSKINYMPLGHIGAKLKSVTS